jgi:hypothetical protein
MWWSQISARGLMHRRKQAVLDKSVHYHIPPSTGSSGRCGRITPTTIGLGLLLVEDADV